VTPQPAERRISPATKQGRTLAQFLTGSSLDRFAAEAWGDHVLPSTVSLLEKRFGLRFEREVVKRVSTWGEFNCTRYSLDPANRALARRLLSGAQ